MTYWKKINPIIVQHTTPKFTFCSSLRIFHALLLIICPFAPLVSFPPFPPTPFPACGNVRQHPTPTVTGTAVVTPFSAVNVDVEIWGQSGSQIMGCVGIGAVPVGMGGGAASGVGSGVAFGLVEGKAKDTPEAREGIVVLDL